MRHPHNRKSITVEALNGDSAAMAYDGNQGQKDAASQEKEESVVSRPAPRLPRWGAMETAVLKKEEHLASSRVQTDDGTTPVLPRWCRHEAVRRLKETGEILRLLGLLTNDKSSSR